MRQSKPGKTENGTIVSTLESHHVRLCSSSLLQFVDCSRLRALPSASHVYPSPLLALRFTRYRYTVAPFLSHSNSVTMPAALQVELSLPISHPASTFTSSSVYASLATFIAICAALLFRHNHRPSLLGTLTSPFVLRFATSACAVLALQDRLSCFASSTSLPASFHIHLLEGLLSLALV